MGNKMSKPKPDPIVKGECDYNLKSNTIDRVVRFVVILRANIQEFKDLADGTKTESSELAKFVERIQRSVFKGLSTVLPAPIAALASGIIFSASILYTYLSKTANQIEAIKTLWHIDDGPANQAKFLEEVILAATMIFLNYEIPCNLFGRQYMDLVAKDAVKWIFNYLGSKSKDVYEPDWILNGVLRGGSTKDGILAQIGCAAGYKLKNCNTAQIFVSPGIVTGQNSERILRKPKHKVYGYRSLRPNEPEPPKIPFGCNWVSDNWVSVNWNPKTRTTIEFDKLKLPSITNWEDASTKELIDDICTKVKEILKDEKELLYEIKNNLQAIEEQLSSISKVGIETLDVATKGLIVSIETRDMVADLSKQCGAIKNSRPQLVNVFEPESIRFGVEDPIESFTGRDDELSKLHKLLTDSNGTRRVINHITVLSGLGGVGKSELAKRYVELELHKSDYQENVIWISEVQASVRNSLLKLFEEHFRVSVKDSEKRTDTDELLEKLYEWCSTRKCLIVFDNVEVFDVFKLLPKISSTTQIPTVLITSRKTIWRQGVKVLPLDVLSIPDAVKFVNDYAAGRTETEKTVLNLVKTLGRLPLALQQAAAYIKAELCEDSNPIQKYLRLFKSPKIKQLLEYSNKDLSEHEKITLTTWTVTMEKCGELAEHIMKIISCFEPNNIPTRVFWDQDSSHAFIEDEVKAAVILLKKYSMVSGQSGEINVHRLVQRVIRLNIDKIIVLVLKAGLELLKIYMDPDTNNDDFVKSLVPHAESIWRQAMKHELLIKYYAYFPSLVCERLEYYGRYTGMLHLARDSKSKIETVLGEKHQHTIAIKYNEAEALYDLEEYTESLKILKEILPLSKNELGNDDWLKRDIPNLIAMNLGKQGNFHEELEIYEEVLAIELKDPELGPEHEETLTTRMNIATAWFNLDRLEALEEFNKVYKIEIRDLETENASTLITRRWIARVYAKKGMWKDALEVYESVYKGQEHLLKSDHPDTLKTLEELQQCKTEQAQGKTLECNSCADLQQSRFINGNGTKTTALVRSSSLTLTRTHLL